MKSRKKDEDEDGEDKGGERERGPSYISRWGRVGGLEGWRVGGLEGWRVGRAGKGVEGIHPRGGLEGNIVTFKLNMRHLGLFGPLALVSYGTCSSKRWE